MKNMTKNQTNTTKDLKLLVSALEPSANLHLKPILHELQNYELSGIFDGSFGKPYLESSQFGAMGFVDVLKLIPKAKKAIKILAELSLKADTVLLIDSPAFNIPLAKAIRKINPHIKINYYILPQVWAWKAKRIKVVEEFCDKLASILPFEPSFYTKAQYVGNPLMDEIKNTKTSISKSTYVAFLAGSRKGEINKLMPIFRKVANRLDKKPLLVIPSFFTQKKIDQLYGDISKFEISQNTEEALLKSEFAFVCSGTASLQAAIIGTPFVLVYKAKAIDYAIAKSFIKLPYIGLSNIILHFLGKKPLHEELLQNQVNEETLLKAYKDTNRKKFLQGSLELRKSLKKGSAKEVADLLYF